MPARNHTAQTALCWGVNSKLLGDPGEADRLLGGDSGRYAVGPETAGTSLIMSWLDPNAPKSFLTFSYYQ